MNVLWLMTDEHNPFVAGYAGDPVIRTPFLDSLFQQGISFNAAYTDDPICVPARQAFHTGRWASALKFTVPNYEAMGPFFTRMGYRTAWFGKQHWDKLNNPWMETGQETGALAKTLLRQAGITPPPESRLVTDAYITPWSTDFNPEKLVADQAIEYISRQSPNNPFFLGVSLVRPHFPYNIQQEYASRYFEEATQPPIPVVTQAMIDDLSTALKFDRQKFGLDLMTADQDRYCRAVYYGMVEFCDAQLARVFDAMQTAGLLDNTIVIYTSDHGDLMGQHGMWYKNAFYEGSARVPLLINMPASYGITQGARTITAPVNTIDLYPTLCEALGLVAPAPMEGVSLMPLLTGADNGANRVTFSENKRIGISARMIRTPEWKYCWYEDGREHLFDMINDRDTEVNNRAADPTLATLKKNLKQRALANWDKKGLGDNDD